MDVGPWNIRDDYWTTHRRPLVESQYADRATAQNGSVPTNRAGIDLTPAAVRALELDPDVGVFTVDWQFITNEDIVMADPALPPDQSARLTNIIVRLEQLLGVDRPIAPAPAPIAAPAAPDASDAPVLSPIDKVLGGQALVGLKTPLAIVAYAALSIFQAMGAAGTATGDKATTTGQVLTTLIGAFGGLGVTAKVDRVTQSLDKIGTAVKPLVPVLVRVLSAIG